MRFAGVAFTSRVIRDDYILQSAEPLLCEQRTYNCAILNPPYGKINQTSEWRLGLRSLGIETVNLYTAFVAVALGQMEDGGEIVAITPRSFCNGSYYNRSAACCWPGRQSQTCMSSSPADPRSRTTTCCRRT